MSYFKFSKNEKLKSRKAISQVFSSGKYISEFPIKLVYLSNDSDSETGEIKAGFSVPKKKFKSAVTRNLLKRRMREAYRLNKSILFSKLSNKSLLIMFIYVHHEIKDSQSIQSSMKNILSKLSKRID